MDLAQWATVVGGFGTGIAVLVGIAAIVPALMQVTNGRRLAREAGALQAHRDYLKLCFENAEFSSAALFKKTFTSINLDEIGTTVTIESEKYLWFLSIMLNTCEQILNFVSSEGPWCEVVEAQLGFHAEALSRVWPDWQSKYGMEMQQLVRRAAAPYTRTETTAS